MDKIVILVWTQKCRNQEDAYWGLGDLIRGTIRLFQLHKELNFKFEVNLILHPISKFINTKPSDYDEFIQNNKNNIEFILTENVENYIKNSSEDIIFFSTNSLCKYEEITDECKYFIKNLLTPNDELNQYIDNIVERHNLNGFEIIHYRLGDKYFNDDKTDINLKIFKPLINKILFNHNDKSVFLSDSKIFKSKFKLLTNVLKNKDITILDLNICHLGYENDLDKIKDTLTEFFIITKSNKIKTYSVYPWISGFVFWISIIYNIPLINI